MRQLFWNSLPLEPHFSRTIVDSLIGLAIRHDVEILYTGTNSGDIRFRTATVSGQSRIFMTLTWQPRAERFFIQTQCSTQQAQDILGELLLDEEVNETSEKEPQRSQLKIKATVNRITSLRQVFIQAMHETQHL